MSTGRRLARAGGRVALAAAVLLSCRSAPAAERSSSSAVSSSPSVSVSAPAGAGSSGGTARASAATPTTTTADSGPDLPPVTLAGAVTSSTSTTLAAPSGERLQLPARPSLAVRGDGIGAVAFGAPLADAETLVAGELGPPLADEDDCGAASSLRSWPSLELRGRGGRFAGWRTSSPEWRTPEGIGVGVERGQVEAAYGPPSAAGGADGDRYQAGGGPVVIVASETGRVVALWAGAECPRR